MRARSGRGRTRRSGRGDARSWPRPPRHGSRTRARTPRLLHAMPRCAPPTGRSRGGRRPHRSRRTSHRALACRAPPRTGPPREPANDSGRTAPRRGRAPRGRRRRTGTRRSAGSAGPDGTRRRAPPCRGRGRCAWIRARSRRGCSHVAGARLDRSSGLRQCAVGTAYRLPQTSAGGRGRRYGRSHDRGRIDQPAGSPGRRHGCRAGCGPGDRSRPGGGRCACVRERPQWRTGRRRGRRDPRCGRPRRSGAVRRDRSCGRCRGARSVRASTSW